MPNATTALATTPATVRIDAQHDLLRAPLTTPLPTPQRRPNVLLRFLQTLGMACTRGHPLESRWIDPGMPRQETPTEILARQYPYMYIRALVG